MKPHNVTVSLRNGHTIHMTEDAENEHEIKNEILGETGNYHKNGVFFDKKDVVSVEVSEQT
ncbi:hypothetical protein [Natribacillus halophilus]|uniref:Uncharacterized protein n=1 Tax=Natribacillus halophilus TaxID=549003 RepID=A0A1G8NU19_9BACI|nr:hypothetical protein [Natribacillus halophilus]SDI83749.1 hypothetical protein SAMN04488123_10734 [Natribacillus halophilus]